MALSPIGFRAPLFFRGVGCELVGDGDNYAAAKLFWLMLAENNQADKIEREIILGKL